MSDWKPDVGDVVALKGFSKNAMTVIRVPELEGGDYVCMYPTSQRMVTARVSLAALRPHVKATVDILKTATSSN